LVDVLTRLVGVVAAQGEKFDRLNERSTGSPRTSWKAELTTRSA